MTATIESLAALPVGPGAPKLADLAVDEALRVLPGWSRSGGPLARSYRFADWRATMAFVNAVSEFANALDHHPELAVGWGRCTVAWSTHDAGGITQNDLACAARTEVIARRAGAK
ncbi:MAG: 4a-hydroxytetrahydrobiopterin dehydratase [Betaproteobacteria bacterium]